MKEQKTECPSCGAKSLQKGNVPLVRVVGEREFTATVPGFHCSGCEESITDLQDGERFDLAIAELLSEAAPTGASFRFLRRASGLRAQDVAGMLGVTGDTISRWENDRHAIDRAAFFLLGQVARELRQGSSATLDRLRREAPKTLPARVEVDLGGRPAGTADG